MDKWGNAVAGHQGQRWSDWMRNKYNLGSKEKPKKTGKIKPKRYQSTVRLGYTADHTEPKD